MEGKGKAAIPCFFFFFFFFFFGFSLVVNAALLDFLAATREREREVWGCKLLLCLRRGRENEEADVLKTF
jgi:hypothetical protein